MLKELFCSQKHYLDYFFENLDIAKAEAVVEVCLKIKGFLMLTGVGKSGIIAEKIAMTLVSTGTRALFLPPVNFLHGDLGILSSEDCIFLISKSGETEELLDLIPFIKKKKVPIVALVSNQQSRLAQYADHVMTLPVARELCPFDLVPTTSTEVQLLFGDVLSTALMKKKGFTLLSYGENHPRGSIGKRAYVKVHEIMIQSNCLPLCSPYHKLADAIVIFSQKNLGCLLVTDEEGAFQGILTEGDLRRSLQSFGPEVMEQPIELLMNKNAMTTHGETLAWEALQRMQQNPKKWITVLPVIEDKQLIGLIRMHDIIHYGIV